MKTPFENKKIKVKALIRAAKGDISLIQLLKTDSNFLNVFYELNGRYFEYPSHKPITVDLTAFHIQLNTEALIKAGSIPGTLKKPTGQ